MSSASDSSSSASSSDGDDRKPSYGSDREPNPESIDQSLDALENQLASISMSSRSPTATLEDEEEVEEREEEEEQTVEQLTIGNGSLTGGTGVEGASDSNEDEHIEGNAESSSGVIKESHSSVWRNILEADEVERTLSPSSSGYAGERGSTSGGDDINDDDEDDNEIHEVEKDGVSGSRQQWVSGKRHPDEVSSI